MTSEYIKFAFTGGELSEELHGRSDLEGFQSGFKYGENVLVDWRGGIKSRPGTLMCEPLFEDNQNPGVRLSTFSFNTDPEDNYLLVWKHRKLYFILQGRYLFHEGVAEIAYNQLLTGAEVGDIVLVFRRTAGEPQYLYTGRVRDNTSLFVPYRNQYVSLSSNDYARKVYYVDTLYNGIDLHDLNFLQDKNTILVTNRNYKPQILERDLTSSDISFSFKDLEFVREVIVPGKTDVTQDRKVAPDQQPYDDQLGGFQWTVAVQDKQGTEYPIFLSDAKLVEDVNIGKKVVRLAWDIPESPNNNWTQEEWEENIQKFKIYASLFKPNFDLQPTPLSEDPITVAVGNLRLPHISLRLGQVAETFNMTLPRALGGKPDYTYTLANVPDGLTFNPDTRLLQGEPTTVGNSTLTYQVTDADNNSEDVEFVLRIQPEAVDLLTFGNVRINDLARNTGQTVAIILPTANGGKGTKTYTLTGLGASGFAFDGTSRLLSGTAAVAGTYELLYQVQDADSPAQRAELSFILTLIDVSLAVAAIPDVSAKAGDLLTIQFPTPTRGTPPYRYTLNRGVAGMQQAGLAFTGRPTTSGTYNMSLVISDGAGTNVTRNFVITVTAATGLNLPNVADRTYPDNGRVNFQLPAASGGVPAYTYTATFGVSAGLVFNASSRRITGRITQSVEITYKVTDAEGTTQQEVFTFNVQGAERLSLETLPDRTVPSAGSELRLQLPQASGGTPPYTYDIVTTDPDSPNTAGFDPQTIRLAILIINANGVFRYRVTDSAGATANELFEVNIEQGGTGGGVDPSPGGSVTPQEDPPSTPDFSITVVGNSSQRGANIIIASPDAKTDYYRVYWSGQWIDQNFVPQNNNGQHLIYIDLGTPNDGTEQTSLVQYIAIAAVGAGGQSALSRQRGLRNFRYYTFPTD